MTTAADLVAEARRYLLPTAREPMNLLSGAHTDSTTTFTFTYDIPAITVGSYLSVDLEILYVWATAPASKSVTVQRAMQGTTAASHTDGTLVAVNPRFSDFAVLQAVNADLDDLSSTSNGLWAQPETVVEFTYQPQIQGYDLTSIGNFINILAIHYDTPGPWRSWPELRRWQVKRGMDVTDFASGVALVLYDVAYPGRDVRVVASLPFTRFAALTDTTTAAGLSSTMTDIPPLGAAARLSGVRETQRNQFEAQGDPRRATEVPPNAQLAGSRGLLQLRASRIRAESARLMNNYPVRRRAAAV